MKLEDLVRFRVQAIFTFGPDLAVQCTKCSRWTAHINRPLTLAELLDRCNERVEDCQ